MVNKQFKNIVLLCLMLKKLWNYILLLIYYFYHNIISRSKVENNNPSLLDVYTETQKKRLLNTYNDGQL